MAEGGSLLCSGAALPSAHYTGLDIGLAQVQATEAVRPDGNVYHSPIQDFDSKHRFDLVLCLKC